MLKRDEWRQYNQLVIQNKNLISFASPAPSLEVLRKYFSVLKKRLGEVLDVNGFNIFNYSENQGDFDLRTALSNIKLVDEELLPEQLIITNGGQEAIKMVVETILEPGDTVLVEKRSYIGIEQPLIDRKVKYVALEKDLNEYSLDDLEKLILSVNPKLLYVVSDFPSPTGVSLNEEKRKLLADLSNKRGFCILEDSTYKQLKYDGKNGIKSIFSQCRNCLITGSATKIVVPGLRIGWLAVKDEELLSNLVKRKESYSLSTASINQKVLALILEKDFRDMIQVVRQYYGRKMRLLIDSLEKRMPEGYEWTRPEGGFYLEVRGLESFKATDNLKKAVENGVSYMPSRLFSFGATDDRSFRLSVSNVDESLINEGVLRLVRSLQS